MSLKYLSIMFAQRLAGLEAVDTEAKHADKVSETPRNYGITFDLNNFLANYLLAGSIKHPHLVSWFHCCICLSAFIIP